jgi:hypothetical protein
VVAHAIYRQLNFIHSLHLVLQQRMFRPLKLFLPPSSMQLWFMGFIGLVALFYIYVILGDKNIERTSVGPITKVIEGLMPFAYTPFVLLIPSLYKYRKEKVSAGNFILVGVFFFMLLIFSVASNFRGAFAIAIMTLVLCFIVGAVTNLGRGTRFSGSTIVFIFIVGLVGFWMLSNLAIAMQIARVNRGQVSGGQMVRDTIRVLGDRSEMQDFERNLYDAESTESGYSEYYVGNPLISRFISTKFHDNGHYYASMISSSDYADFRKFMVDRLWAQLPGPVLRISGIQVDKLGVASLSFGDWFVLKATSIEYPAFRVGSYQAGALVAFGFFAPFVIIVGAIIIFSVVDTLVVRRMIGAVGKRHYVTVGLAPVSLIFIYSLIFSFERESLVDWAGFIIRFFPQMLLLYAALMVISKPLASARS